MVVNQRKGDIVYINYILGSVLLSLTITSARGHHSLFVMAEGQSSDLHRVSAEIIKALRSVINPMKV